MTADRVARPGWSRPGCPRLSRAERGALGAGAASIGPYSPALGTHLLQYDHVAHAFVSFVAAFACWVMLAAPHAAAGHRRELVILAAGAALGLGALNEVAEFLATLAHHGAHAGGYWNTGWDLACNLIGAGAAGLVIARSPATAA